MPRFDKTGPLGQGQSTGWGHGVCGGGMRRGFGQGFCRFSSKITKQEEVKILNEELKSIKERLSELKNKK